MNRKLSFSVDDESNDIVKRYEQFLEGTATGYFDVEELEMIVEYYLRKGRTKDCTKALELGLQLHPNNNALRTKRAKIYLAVGDTKKAFKVLESLTETTDYEVQILKIEVLLKLDRTHEARLLSDKVLKEETDDSDNVYLDIAYIYLGLGDFTIALDFLKMGDKHNRKNSDLLFELAFCYEQCDDFDNAITTYNRIIDLDPYVDEAWFNLGQIYFAMQDFTHALEAYDFALTINEKDSLTCLQKGHVQFQLDQFEDAIETYREYQNMTTDKWQSDLFIAECYEKLENYEESIKYYLHSLEAFPKNFEALTGVGICLLELERFLESQDYIKQALLLNDEAADAWVYLAESYVGLDENEDALLSYLKSITLDPEQPDTLMAIANICLEKGEYETAKQYYLMASGMDASLEFVDLFIAVAYFKLGNPSDSAIYLEKAIRADETAASLFLELCPESLENSDNETTDKK
ncbi:MAG: tetratricopeptide repeat protein [Paludibacter sp.]|nr:tetratricopeptide repeat protein [Paludibacter sp.]